MLARNMLASIAIAALTCPSNAFSYPDCVNGPLADNLVCNSQASEAERAAALVSAFNITEKLSLLIKYVWVVF
jgi:beta-D-xylosidase 4